MTKERLLEILQHNGYICHDGTAQRATVYDDKGDPVCECPLATLERMANAEGMTKWAAMWGGVYVSRYLGKRYQDHENREHCRRIADELDEYANGNVYKCPECGDAFTMPDDVGDAFRCPNCGHTDEPNEFEQLVIYDYMDDILDIEYRVDRDRELRSVQVCVGWGGPNIYIDTGSRQVELYWGSSFETWPLSYEAETAVDEWAEEWWGCM